jgi:diguanylate cyclase (GGDEF)-like protein
VTDPVAAALLQAIGDAAWLVHGATFTVTAANEAAQSLLAGPPHGSACGLTGRVAESMLDTLEDAVFWERARAGDRACLESHTAIIAADGSERIVRRSIRPLVDDRQPCGAGGFVVVVHDLTAQRFAEQAHEALLSELRATLESTADGILVTDLQGRVRAFNRRFAALWQLPESLLVGGSGSGAAPGAGSDAALMEWMRNSVAEPLPYARRLAEIDAQAGLAATDTVMLFSGAVLERYTQPQICRGQPIGRVYSFRSAATGVATPAADENSSAGLPGGRPAFVRQLNEALIQARRGGGAVAVLCVEFDGRAIYGFESSGTDTERLWREIAEAIRGCVRHPDIVARIGGTRFAVLAHHIGEAGAETLSRRVISAMARCAGIDVAQGALPVSVGVALYPDAGTTGSELLSHAQTALALAQATPGDGLRVYRAADDPVRADARLGDALRRAIRDGRLRVHYQPVVDLATRRVLGAEALLRWRDAGLGEVAPARIIAAAEAGGLIVGIDEWVIGAAIAQAAAWHARGHTLRIAVNVSPATMLRPVFARRLQGLLAQAGLPAALLDVEVQERALHADPKAAHESLAELAGMGVGVVLDDFGRGASCIGDLRGHPLRAVKIDRTLVRELPQHAGHAAMVEGLALVARSLRIAVLAKGIETDAQRLFFRDIGVDAGQGFWFGAALARERFEQRLPALAA